MKIAVTGGTGLVGHAVVAQALRCGHAVTVLSRRAPAPSFFAAPVRHVPFDLAAETSPLLDGQDALVHAAFSHVPGRYRGGEGEDPAGFLRTNLDGSLRLFEAARRAGLRRIVFLSSRAVYGDQPTRGPLHEGAAPRPTSLYGRLKWMLEEGLRTLDCAGLGTTSLRATGVYGPAPPGLSHKWHDLFLDFAAGRPILARIGTEMHADDLACFVCGLLEGDAASGAVNLSDILLDRRDLLAEVAHLTGWSAELPPTADAAPFAVMDTARAHALGWAPGGRPLLRASLPGMLRQSGWRG